MTTRGRPRALATFAHLPREEYRRLAAKIRRSRYGDDHTEWNRIYSRCYQRGIRPPTLAEWRAGTFVAPPLKTLEEVAESARRARYKVVARHRAALAA